MTDRPREFVVQRSMWLRGVGPDSWLRNEAGHMCCLGFVAKQCGIRARALLHVGTPAELCATSRPRRAIDGILLQQKRGEPPRDSRLATNAMSLNDDDMLTDAEREAKLAALFAKHGYRLRFEP